MKPTLAVLMALPLPLATASLVCQTPTPAGAGAPYPRSSIVTGVTFDRSTHQRHARGSDNWPITWAADGHQYAAWGDGGGFGGSNSRGRVSLGVARIEGTSQSYQGFNVWGGGNAENPAQFGGKSYGILSVNGVLSMWRSPASGPRSYSEARLAFSADRGVTWELADWAFDKADGVILPTFCQFGKDYSGARDGYVYLYAVRLRDGSSLSVQIPGAIDLFRVPKQSLPDASAYEYFAGRDEAQQPVWISDLDKRVPVFEDPKGVGWTVSVSFNRGLGLYLLSTEHTRSFEGNLGIFAAPEPWGPWSTVGYYSNWEGFGSTFFWNFSNKWLGADGREFTMIFTGTDDNDSWNTIRGRFRSSPAS